MVSRLPLSVNITTGRSLCSLATQTFSSVSRPGASLSISTTSGAASAMAAARSMPGAISETMRTPAAASVCRSDTARPSPS
ncbi:hypothetical protein G6F40_017777 [Rhizopus arrhizus]|nr:hypothetical protein G6F40_017777 [Rhizopus arrhizus]